MSPSDASKPSDSQTTHRSRWQRFSPSMGWKAFWSEILIVILGVLIALAANEAVQNWSWQNKVRDGEARLKVNIEAAFLNSTETVAVAPCVDAQLQAMAENLLKEGGVLQPLPRFSETFSSGYVIRFPDRNFGMPVWDALSEDGTVAFIPEFRREGYQLIYDQLARLDITNEKINNALGRLAVMAYPIKLDAAIRKELLTEIEEQRSHYKIMAVSASQLMQWIGILQLVPRSEQVEASLKESGTVKFCKAHGYPLADWRDALKPEAN